MGIEPFLCYIIMVFFFERDMLLNHQKQGDFPFTALSRINYDVKVV